MRRPFTLEDAAARNISRAAVRWAVTTGAWQRLGNGVFVAGVDPPTPVELALGAVVASGGVASGSLAGVLYGLDAVTLRAPFLTLQTSSGSRRAGVRHRAISAVSIVNVGGYLCTDGLQTMVDLAADLNDLQWEQALECALRKELLVIKDFEGALGIKRVGNSRIRRVLSLRPDGAPFTDSLLETLMVQLIRTEPRLPEPQRQVEIYNRYERFVARVGLAWPELGIFIEPAGEHHKYQPVYDASRETAVAAATRWLPARFTWTEVVRHPRQTLRSLVELVHG